MYIPSQTKTLVEQLLRPYLPNITVEEIVKAYQAPERKAEGTLLNREEVKAALRVSLPTVDRLLAEGNLPKVKIRGRVFVRLEDVEKLMEAK